MQAIKPKPRFEISGYYFIGLVVLVLAGFWPSYFVKFFNGTANFKFYFHFHAAMMAFWIAMLIVQPILIRKKQLALHRLVGKVSYILFPAMLISILLLAHSRHTLDEKDLDINLFVPFKDVLLMGTAYFIAIRYRRNINLHARAMIATGMVFIEPSLARLTSNMTDGSEAAMLPAFLVTIGVVYAIFIFLIITERHQKSGRWVFPLILGMYIVFHAILVFGVHIGFLEAFSKWFIALPIT